MLRKNSSAFTLVEMLVVISIIAVIAGLAFPAISGAITQAQLTQTVSNARQLYLAGFQMAGDGTTNSDPTLAWPGDAVTSSSGGSGGTSTPIASLQDYVTKLVQNDYLKGGDLQKMLSAPSANLTVTTDSTSGVPTIAGVSALKVYKVHESDPSTTIFAVTSNYTYDTALTATGKPFADKGFVVIRKGGDASKFRKNQATTTGWQSASTFQTSVGRIPGDTEGTVSAGDSGKFLTNPQDSGGG